MIVFLLLVIIAILLFGSSVVLRGIGMVLGFIALFFAVIVGIMVAEQVPAWLWWTIGLFVGGGVTSILVLDVRQHAKLRRDIAGIEARTAIDMERIQEKNRRAEEEIRRRPTIKFYNDGLNKKKRKRLSRQDGVDHAARRKLLAPESRRMRMDLLAKRPRNEE